MAIVESSSLVLRASFGSGSVHLLTLLTKCYLEKDTSVDLEDIFELIRKELELRVKPNK